MEELARSLDLNTLHNLSLTCRLFRANLLQFRNQLMVKALRCVNDSQSKQIVNPAAATDQQPAWPVYGYDLLRARMTSGKVGPCARDLVSECRRCGSPVCRNCTTKPPSAATLPNRLRRLCATCIKAPLLELLDSPVNSTNEPSFTHAAFIREPCSCAESVYICQSCGRPILINADSDYKRIWNWRVRYSTYLGGLGTGIGEGNEGVQCARGERCLDARNIEVEMDCDGTPDEADSRPSSQQSGVNGATSHDTSGEVEKAGYFRQEIEGVGGRVRGKYKKMVRVGRTVEEYEEERDTAEYLRREVRQECRSWCGWCNRVVLGRKDKNI